MCFIVFFVRSSASNHNRHLSQIGEALPQFVDTFFPLHKDGLIHSGCFSPADEQRKTKSKGHWEAVVRERGAGSRPLQRWPEDVNVRFICLVVPGLIFPWFQSILCHRQEFKKILIGGRTTKVGKGVGRVSPEMQQLEQQ